MNGRKTCDDVATKALPSDELSLAPLMSKSTPSPSSSSPRAFSAADAFAYPERLCPARRMAASSRPCAVPSGSVSLFSAHSARKTSTLAQVSIQHSAASNGLHNASDCILKVSSDASLGDSPEKRAGKMYTMSIDKVDNTEKAPQRTAHDFSNGTKEQVLHSIPGSSLNSSIILGSPSILEKISQCIQKQAFGTLTRVTKGNTANATFKNGEKELARKLTNKAIEKATTAAKEKAKSVALNSAVRAFQQSSGRPRCSVGKADLNHALDEAIKNTLGEGLESASPYLASKIPLPLSPLCSQPLAHVRWSQVRVSSATSREHCGYARPMVYTLGSGAPNPMAGTHDGSLSTERKRIFNNHTIRPTEDINRNLEERSGAKRAIVSKLLSLTLSEHTSRQQKGWIPVLDIAPTNLPAEDTGIGDAVIRSTEHRLGTTCKASDGVTPVSLNMIEPEGQKAQGLQFAATGTRVLQAHRGTPAIKKELCLYPLAVFIVLFTTAFFVLLLRRFYLGDGFKLERTMLPEMCRAINCVQEANYLSKLLSLALDPCDNFYRFVCDRSTREYSILRDVHEGPTDRYVGKLEAMMYPLLTSGNQTDVAPVLRSLFNQCSNGKKVVEDGWKPVLELMSRVSLQGFPLTSPIEDVSVWKVAAKLLRKTGTAAFLSVSVTSHPSTRKDIASLDLPEALSMISGVEMSEIIRIYTKSVFYAVSVLAEKQVPSVHMLNVVRFASELEKLHQNHSINRTSQLKKFNPESPLHYFLSEVFANVPGIVYASGGNSEVIINAPEFCSELQRLVDRTEPHIVMNFLGVKLLIHIAPFLPWPDLHDVFSSLVYRKSRFGVERWRFCLRAVEQALPSLFLQFSLLAIGNRRLIAMSTKLVTAIKREFLSNIHSTTHLNNASKTVIQVLISTTTFKIMGASWIYNKNLDMQIDDPALYEINSALHSYVSVQEMAFMTKIARGSSNRWPLSAFSTDCWYESGSRTIYVPMLIFSVSLRGSDTSQIAQAGIWIGRCIFYMLLYVANSKNISGQWLSEEARHTMAATGRCFSELTQAQLMAALRDGLATRVAYDHFQKVVGGRSKPIRLRLATDEIVMGAEQLFFVYLVLQLCEARTGPYSLSSATEVLWNAVLRHEPGFSNAFGCRPGTSMHPAQWCGPAQLNSLYYAQLSPRVV